MTAFLKHLPKNISAILTICDDVSILRFRYMLRSNPEHSGGRDPSNYILSIVYSLSDGGGWSKMKISFLVSSQSILSDFHENLKPYSLVIWH